MKINFTIEQMKYASESEWGRICDIISEAVENHAKCSAQSLPREKWKEEFVDENGNFDREMFSCQCNVWRLMMYSGIGGIYVARANKDIVGALVVMPSTRVHGLLDFDYCSVCKKYRRKGIAFILSIYALKNLRDSGVMFVNINHDKNNPAGRALCRSVTRFHVGLPLICNAKDKVCHDPLLGVVRVERNGKILFDLSSKIVAAYGIAK